MKKLLFVLLAIGSLRAGPIDVNSAIRDVTVYADRARITRAADVNLPAGESVVRFPDLPVTLDASSVQAAGTASGAFKILGIEMREKYSEETLNEKVAEIEKALEALEDEARKLAVQKSALADRVKFLGKVRDGLTMSGDGDKTPPQGVEKIKPLYDFYSAELESLNQQSLAADVSVRDLAPKRRVLEAELNRLRGNAATAQREVLVAVRTDSPLAARLTLGYNMANASWQPAYDARVNTKDGKIDLTSYGVVQQQTGEDWKNAKLSLSTARPSVGARMQELNPWWLQVLEFRPLAAARMAGAEGAPAPMVASAMEKDVDQLADKPGSVSADFEVATIESSGISTVFEIKIPANIPSDGEPHKVPIGVQKFDGKMEYVSTPKLAELAYLKAKLTNTSGAPLLGGKVNLFRDGDFVGESRVNFIAADADFDFYLGVDDGVKITRKQLLDRASEGGLINKRKGVTRKYETTVENFKGQPVKLTLIDQLPVSQDASITVVDARFSEAPKSQEKDTGKLTWEFTIDPKQKKTLTEEFTVQWPADKQVTGL